MEAFESTKRGAVAWEVDSVIDSWGASQALLILTNPLAEAVEQSLSLISIIKTA